MSVYLPAAYGPLTHTIFPATISTLISYRNPHFPLNLNKEKRVSWDGWTLLWDAYISAIYTDEAIVQTAAIFPAFKNNLEEIR
jgi:hypothetical protein